MIWNPEYETMPRRILTYLQLERLRRDAGPDRRAGTVLP